MPVITRRPGDPKRSGLAGVCSAASLGGLWPCLIGVGLVWLGSVWTGPVGAAELSLPTGSRTSYSETLDPDGYDMPVGVWAERLPIRRVEGRVDRIVYRIPDAGPNSGTTVLQTVIPLRRQLDLQGYELLFECTDHRCGGFDFRFATEVIPAPDMYVDMTDFHFLAAQDSQTGRVVTVLTSRSATDRFVQVIRVAPSQGTRGGGLSGGRVSTASRGIMLRPVARGEAGLAPNTGLVSAPDTGSTERAGDAGSLDLTPASAPEDTFGATLMQRGHVVLDDLVFASGAGGLGAGPFPSLGALAEFLKSDTTRRVVLVGHTDAVGSRDSNLRLSQRRAQAARNRLVQTYGVSGAQITAEGMGYLAPRASNLTDAGRIANRRVEAVLLP